MAKIFYDLNLQPHPPLKPAVSSTSCETSPHHPNTFNIKNSTARYKYKNGDGNNPGKTDITSAVHLIIYTI